MKACSIEVDDVTATALTQRAADYGIGSETFTPREARVMVCRPPRSDRLCHPSRKTAEQSWRFGLRQRQGCGPANIRETGRFKLIQSS